MSYLALATRLQDASEGSRELDVDLWILLMGGEDVCLGDVVSHPGGVRRTTRGKSLRQYVERYPNDKAGASIWYQVPQLTTSLDACGDLINRVFSNMRINLYYKPSGFYGAVLVLPMGREFARAALGRTKELALAGAVLARVEATNQSPEVAVSRHLDEVRSASR